MGEAVSAEGIDSLPAAGPPLQAPVSFSGLQPSLHAQGEIGSNLGSLRCAVL